MSFFLPRNEPVSNLVGAHHGTWRVPRERVSESFGRLQLRAGSEDCAQIWYVLRRTIGQRFTRLICGAHRHVRACAPLFHISGTAERIALKFGVF